MFAISRVKLANILIARSLPMTSDMLKSSGSFGVLSEDPGMGMGMFMTGFCCCAAAGLTDLERKEGRWNWADTMVVWSALVRRRMWTKDSIVMNELVA